MPSRETSLVLSIPWPFWCPSANPTASLQEDALAEVPLWYRHTVLIAALRTSIQLHHPLPHQELLGALLPAFPRSCFFPWKPGLQFRLSGWEPDVWQVQEQSLCPRVNLNFCGFFFLKHGVGILHVNTSGKKIRFNNAYTEKGIPGALHSWATRLLPASDTWRTAGFSKTPEQIAWFSKVLCL